MELNKSTKIQLVAVLMVLIASGGFSYYKFQSFKYKFQDSEQAEVKGANTSSNPVDLPFYPGAEEISSNRGEKHGDIAIQTAATKEEVKKFYTNILLSDGWVIKQEILNEAGASTKYQKDGSKIVIAITKDSKLSKTIVNIEYELK